MPKSDGSADGASNEPRAVHYVDAGQSTTVIAKELGVGGNTVCQALIRVGIAARPRPVHPELSDVGWLRHRYVDEQLPARQIAAELGAHENSVLKALARAGIPRRSVGGQPFEPRLADVEWLRAQFVDARRTAASIAADLGRLRAAVTQALRRHKIRRPTPVRPSTRQLRRDWQQTGSVRALSRRYQASEDRVTIWLAESGVSIRDRPRLPGHRLQTRIAAGDNLTALARRFRLRRQQMIVELLHHGLALPAERDDIRS